MQKKQTKGGEKGRVFKNKGVRQKQKWGGRKMEKEKKEKQDIPRYPTATQPKQ